MTKLLSSSHQRLGTKLGAFVLALIGVLLAVWILGVPNPAASGHEHGSDTEHSHAHESQEYICPMHPQVRSTDPTDRCPICGMELVPVESSSREEDAVGIEFSGRALALLNLQTTPASRQRGSEQLRLIGQLEFDETHLTSISAWTAGRIERLHVQYTGAFVEAGDPLADIYSPELLVAQQELIQAQRQVAGDSASESPAFMRESNQTTVRAARERLRLLGLNQAQLDDILERGEATDRVTIYAPNSGVVTYRAVRQGDYVETGSTLVELSQPSRFWAVFELYERDLGKVAVGDTLDMRLSRGADTSVQGEVVSVAPVLDSERRTRQVRVAIEDTDARLVAGSFVQAQLNIERDDALLIPASAPLLTGQRAVVYVEQSPGYFEAREVTLGSRLGDNYEVVSGLDEGELVVSRGAFRIDSELQLRGRPSMMAPDGNGSGGHDHGGQAHAGHDDADEHSNGSDHASEEHGHNGHQDHAQHNGHGSHAHGYDAAAADNQGTSLSIDSGLDIDVRDVFARYHDLWYALHNDDLAAWQQAAPLFYDAVAGVQWPQHAAEIESHLNQGAGHAHHVNDIARARDHFYAHSLAVIALAHSGYHKGTLYLMFCPMARDDAGAYWLQQNDGLLNPYFGSQMLRCGSMRGALEGAAGGHGE